MSNGPACVQKVRSREQVVGQWKTKYLILPFQKSTTAGVIIPSAMMSTGICTNATVIHSTGLACVKYSLEIPLTI